MQENLNTEPKDRSQVLLQIGTTKNLYRQNRRPVLWYVYFEVVIFITAILAGVGAYLFNIGFLGIISGLLGLGFIILIIGFFSVVLQKRN